MPGVTMRSRGGGEYQVDLSVSYAALMRNCVEMDVTGRYRSDLDEHWVEERFTVRLVPDEHRIQVIYHDEVIGEIDLTKVDPAFEEANDRLDEEIHRLSEQGAWDQVRNLVHDHGGDMAEESWSRIKDLFLAGGGERVEQAIQTIPAFDPVLGCLIKSGLSTSIGHLVRCNALVGDVPGARARVRSILRCLGGNSISIAVRFTARTVRCAVMGGWDIIG